jgi:S1-C subfamily serine protease
LKRLPSLPRFGKDLTTAEKQTLGLTEKQMAFRLGERAIARATKAGAKSGDVVIGIDDHKLELTGAEALEFVKREYLVGDTVKVTVLRDGKKQTFNLTLANR